MVVAYKNLSLHAALTEVEVHQLLNGMIVVYHLVAWFIYARMLVNGRVCIDSVIVGNNFCAWCWIYFLQNKYFMS